ncbi:hypothetical protein PIB30_012357 [Stylosanthes scabra]|uniref:Uncharacterized protein n=1 Tax=Stylosanthes scabra TaxID=79078 RepID=A0ABU6Z557_9FABA|nr:hypothetical protein [Stylosanthes scabra]
MHDSETLGHVLPTFTTTGILVPINTPYSHRFSSPPVCLEIHRLDSLQQPKLGADWAHPVLYSPQNIGTVAGDDLTSLDK